MNKKLSESSRTFFHNTMRMVNFTNRLKEENAFWNKYKKVKKRRLEEVSTDEDDRISEKNYSRNKELVYENKYFKDKDESFTDKNTSIEKMDISLHEENNIKNLRHLNESNSKLKKKNKKILKDLESSSPESLSDASSDNECLIDNSFNSLDDSKLIKSSKNSSKKSKKAFEKKIKKREKLFKKQLEKSKKKKKKSKSKKSKN